MRLLIAAPGPRLPHGDLAGPVGLPVLPALAGLLDRARRLPPAADWRSGVLAALCGVAGGSQLPAAAVAARAVALPCGAGLCFAAPLHVIAGISRVHLPPGGWLRLAAEEEDRWVEAFNQEFGGPGLWLHSVGGGWLLAAPFAAAARDAAPETLIGDPLTRLAARDEAERALRRLGAEVELWLAGHPLNRAREARGQPPLNCLWFWGGAPAVQLPHCARAPRALLVAGEPDPWLAGLAAHCAVPLVHATDWQSLTACADALLVLAPPPEGAGAAHWQMLEEQWFAPAARSLRAGEIGALRLQIGASAWQLPDPSPLRWLRRRRPWHQRVLT
ncbi:MAG TPA: hypothetical protein VMH77_03010 [Steroidobacteraceae bacterium]|nr:hypothetical protein [Steroidobacteraceae bacterium]